MRNLTKHLLLLIAIFPVIILLPSIFAEKAVAVPTCADKGGYCINESLSGAKCSPGFFNAGAFSFACFDTSVTCCLPNPTPTIAPTSTPAPALTTTSSCQTNSDCFSGQTCVGSSFDNSTTCLKQGAGGIGSYCGTPDKSPNHLACSSLYCDSSLRCAANPRFLDVTLTPTSAPVTGLTWQLVAVCEGPTEAPTLGPTGGPTPTAGGHTSIPTNTPIPAIACATKTDCNNPPECRTVEGRQCINPGLPSAVCIYGTKPKGIPCKIGGQNGICSNNGFCDLSAPTPTPTGVAPTGSPTPTPTPIPAGMTSAHFKVALSGIVDNPSRPNRKLNIEIFDPENNNAKIADLTADIAHDSSVKQFKKIHVLDAIPKSGIYNIKVKSDGYLRRLILSVRITKGNQNDVPLAILIPGDINGDNRIDLLDYNLFITCYGTRANQPTCDKTVLKLADFDDNIVIDGIDYNTFIKGLSVKEGD